MYRKLQWLNATSTAISDIDIHIPFGDQNMQFFNNESDNNEWKGARHHRTITT